MVWDQCALTDWRNRFKGSVILLASGPSSKEFPVDRLQKLPVIAMNGSILLCQQCCVHPLIYLCDDPGFVRDRSQLALQGAQMADIVATRNDVIELWEKISPGSLQGKKLLLLQRVNRGEKVVSDRLFAWRARHDPDMYVNFSFLYKKANTIGFSLNMEKGYFSARTVPYTALQLAVYLGFHRVLIVGMDLSSKIGRFYEQGQAALPTSLDQDYADHIYPSFLLFSERVMRPLGLQVANFSYKSRLPVTVLPKIGIDQLDAFLDGEGG